MGDRFDIQRGPLDGLMIVQRKKLEDARGFLQRVYDQQALSTILAGRQLAQINHTLTRLRGTVRGMHWQRAPHAEAKLILCLRGEVFDVAVDVRPQSPTYLRWHAEVLSAANGRALFIPEGFAHGFQAMTDDCELLYLHTAAYAPHAEAGAHPLDVALAISWPLPVTNLSARDASHPPLGPAPSEARQ